MQGMVDVGQLDNTIHFNYVRQLSIDSVPETRFQARVDIVFGLGFLFVAIFAGYRTFKSWTVKSGSRRVISVFNTLLFLASTFRAIWFLIPNNILEPSYEPLPKKLQDYKNETGLLISETLLSLGSFFLYGVFILIACYWYTMLGKLEHDGASATSSSFFNISDSHSVSNAAISTDAAVSLMPPSARESGRALGTLELFVPIITVMILINSSNILFFSWGWFDTEMMTTFDAITFATFAAAVLGAVVYLSHKINRVLRNMEVINQSSSQAQIRRIEAIVFLAKFFFATRIFIELGMCWWMLDFPHVFRGQGRVTDQFWWDSYIIAKHSVEVLVLALELFISSAIRSYDNRRVTTRYAPVPDISGASNFGSSMIGSSIYSGSSGMGIEMPDSTFSGSSRRVSYGAVTDVSTDTSIIRPVYTQFSSVSSSSTVPALRSSLGGATRSGSSMGYNYHSIPIEPTTVHYSTTSGTGTSGITILKGKGHSGVLSVPISSSLSNSGSMTDRPSSPMKELYPIAVSTQVDTRDAAMNDSSNNHRKAQKKKKQLQEV